MYLIHGFKSFTRNSTFYSKLLTISSASGSASSLYRMKSSSRQSTATLEARPV